MPFHLVYEGQNILGKKITIILTTQLYVALFLDSEKITGPRYYRHCFYKWVE